MPKSTSLDKISEIAKLHNFIIEDPINFINPGKYLGVDISLYIATGKSTSEGYHFAGFNDVGELTAFGIESGGPGSFSHGGWIYIKGSFGEYKHIPQTKLSCLWDMYL